MEHNIKTFADACEALKISHELPFITGVTTHQYKSMIAFYKLQIIADALNEGWKPDGNNYNQGKYYPWFLYEKDSSVFSFFGSSVTPTFTARSTSLVYKTSDLAWYAGAQFIAEYNDFLKR